MDEIYLVLKERSIVRITSDLRRLSDKDISFIETEIDFMTTRMESYNLNEGNRESEEFSPEAPSTEISEPEVERMNIERESEENIVYIPTEQLDMVERSIIFEATGTLEEGRLVKKVRNRKKVIGKKKLNSLIYIAGVALLLELLAGIIFHNNKDKGDLKNAEIVEVDKAVDGMSANLLEMSEKAYGHKAYWIYIYDFNREQLSSPVNVKSGIQVEIPDLSMYYGIDVRDTSEIRKALSVTEVLLNMNSF